MYIQQIQGESITRENFTSEGKLINRQEFLVGELVQRDNSYYVRIQMRIYDEALKLKSIYSTDYFCKQGDADILLSVFTIHPKEQKVSVSIESSDMKNLYNLKPGLILGNLNFSMYIESGILNFFGSKNIVEINNRHLLKEIKGWKITENITIKPYLMGIRIRLISYNVTEFLSASGLLEKQVFKGSNGDYFIVAYHSNG